MRPIVVVLALAAAISGCSSHEQRFESFAAPKVGKPVGTAHAAAAAAAITATYEHRIRELPTEALAPLAQAAAVTFRATGAPGMRNLARFYADALLDARVRVGTTTAFFGARQPGVASSRATATAADALIDVYTATQDPRYREAVLDAVRALVLPSFDWVRMPHRAGVRAPDGGLDIAATAGVFRVLVRAADPRIGADSYPDALAAFRVLDGSQVGLGRWYARTRGHVPMNLEEWGRTLVALVDIKNRRIENIAGAGVAALWSAAFRPDGSPRVGGVADPDKRGRAWALGALGGYEANPTWGDLAITQVLSQRRRDGTQVDIPGVDAARQAQYGVAFARLAFMER